ncbi:hypothetical protein CEXT_334501 [Caerostris extrusa]|uniref:Uncharacterized protein n=1 Tax=Caerostris extrusa TaxID=172846 RepID=A0AAV4MX84_CAEEX|nr:hypothetical protein CEXT_334501 [Caerostris extrusa]
MHFHRPVFYLDEAEKPPTPFPIPLQEIRLHHLSHITSTPTPSPKCTVGPSAGVLFLGTCHLKSEFMSRDVKVVCSPAPLWLC